MKKTLAYALILAVTSPMVVGAQTITIQRNDSLKQELNRPAASANTQSQAQSEQVAIAKVQAETVVPATAANTVTVNGQNVLVQQPQAQQPQDLGAQTVEASPLRESKTEKLRKTREQLELQTEQKIVEKLEQDRMEEEQKRAEKLFGNKLNEQSAATATQAPSALQAVEGQSAQNQGQVMVLVPAQQQPVVQAPVAQTAAVADAKKDEAKKEEVKKEEPKVDVKAEIREALADLNKKDEKSQKTKIYVFGLGGAGDYPTVKNVRGKLAAGFGVGAKVGKGLAIEADYVFSRFDIDTTNTYSYYYGYPTLPSPTLEMVQNNISLLAKYNLLEGKVHPVVGGVMSYNMRSYSDKLNRWNTRSAETQALDVGILGGLDLELSENVSVGADIRYMSNLTNNHDQLRNAYDGYSLYYATPVEELNYYQVLVSGKVSF